jgi:hypothetical protein
MADETYPIDTEPSPSPVVDDPYKKAQESDLRSSLYVATALDPDQHAKALELADKFKIPVSVLESAKDQFHQAAKLNAVDIKNLVSMNPRVLQWMNDADNAAIGQDDLHHLARLDQTSADIASALNPVDNREPIPFFQNIFGRYGRQGAYSFLDTVSALPASIEMAVRSVTGTPLTEEDIQDPGFSPAANIIRDQQRLRDDERAAQTYKETFAEKAAGGLWSMLANPTNVVLPVIGGELAMAGQVAKAASKALTGASLVMGEQAALQSLQESVSAKQRERLLGESGAVLPGFRDV